MNNKSTANINSALAHTFVNDNHSFNNNFNSFSTNNLLTGNQIKVNPLEPQIAEIQNSKLSDLSSLAPSQNQFSDQSLKQNESDAFQ